MHCTDYCWSSAKRCARAGRHWIRRPEVLERLNEKLPPFLIYQVEDQYRRLSDLDRQIEGIEKQLTAWAKQNEACQRIMEIPGVGPLVAIMDDAGSFRSGRVFAAYIGLVPTQTGTGGKVRLLGISLDDERYQAFIEQLEAHVQNVEGRKRLMNEKPEWK